jgi:hypothetical protein
MATSTSRSSPGVKTSRLDLESGNAGQGPRGRADFCRKVRQRAEIVSRKRRLIGELHAGDLHSVAGITREADDDRFAIFDRFQDTGSRRLTGRYNHRASLSSESVRVHGGTQGPRQVPS